MEIPAQPEPVKLFVAALWRDPASLDRALWRLEALWGGLDLSGPDRPFEITSYYEEEMGTGLLRRIAGFLPLIAPGVASAALLTFLAAWNEFLFAYTFTATEASRTVPVALALFPGVFEVPWGDIAAASILASLPPIVIVVGLQRWLVRGLVGGALKE